MEEMKRQHCEEDDEDYNEKNVCNSKNLWI